MNRILGITVQIGGPHVNNQTLFNLKRRFKSLGVIVSHPLSNNPIIMHGRRFTFNPQRWSLYEVELDYFQSIAKNRVHIVCNESGSQTGFINQSTALGIAQAFLHNKPVILLHEPVFGKDVDLLLREIITKQKNQLRIYNLAKQIDEELKDSILHLPSSVEYQLTYLEKSLVKSRLKTYFRGLISPSFSYRSLLATGR